MHKEITQKLSVIQNVKLFFRGTYSLLGIAFTIIGVLASFMFLKNFDINDTIKLNGKLNKSKGIITDIYSSGTEVNEREVFAYDYTYEINNNIYKWTSYNYIKNVQIGDSINISYNPSSPEYSIIDGYKSSPGGYLVLLVLLFPAIGLGMLAFTVRKGFTFAKTISQGIITYGKLINSKIVAHGNDGSKDIHKLTFEYSDATNTLHQITIRTQKGYELMDEEQELIIYNKTTPQSAILVDDLPKSVANYIKQNWI